MKMKQILLAVLISAIYLPLYARPAACTEKVTVFAAASTTNALTEIGKLFAEEKKGEVIFSFGSSSTLAKQIENLAPADIFVSADLNWMNYLAEKKLIDPSTRRDLLGNSLVLISPYASAQTKIDIVKGFDLSGMLHTGKLAMGDPAHVPVGIYGKAALEALGVWASVSDKIAAANDVRAALTLVERDEAPLGIVYATDAAISEKVKVIGIFPEDSHPPIVYPIAVISGHKNITADRFLDFMQGNEAKTIFAKYGFTVR